LPKRADPVSVGAPISALIADNGLVVDQGTIDHLRRLRSILAVSTDALVSPGSPA